MKKESVKAQACREVLKAFFFQWEHSDCPMDKDEAIECFVHGINGDDEAFKDIVKGMPNLKHLTSRRTWKIIIYKAEKYNMWSSKIVSPNGNAVWFSPLNNSHKYQVIKNAKSFIKSISRNVMNPDDLCINIEIIDR